MEGQWDVCCPIEEGTAKALRDLEWGGANMKNGLPWEHRKSRGEKYISTEDLNISPVGF